MSKQDQPNEIMLRARLAYLEKEARDIRRQLGLEGFCVVPWGAEEIRPVLVYDQNPQRAHERAGGVGSLYRIREIEPPPVSEVRRRDSLPPGETHWARAAKMLSESREEVAAERQQGRVASGTGRGR